MRYVLDFIYLTFLLLLSPWLLFKALTTGKYRRGLRAKFLGLAPRRNSSRPCAWFHGVSVGEIHLLRAVVAAFRRRFPEVECVVSTTTDTGFEEARKHFAEMEVFYWPLDFSWAVRRALSAIQPSLVVLAEGEMWPNFLTAAEEHGVPVAVINARMSPRSASHYRHIGRLTRRLLAKVSVVAAQTEAYAQHFRALGAKHVHVTGNVKYDGVNGDRGQPKTRQLAALLGVATDDLNLVCGSTQAPEEDFAVSIFKRLRQRLPNVRLFLVPRQRERFEDVATLLKRSGEAFARRSALAGVPRERIVLVDTIGELGALWGLADLAFVGGSLDGKRGGQNMIEPAAYGAAVVFGPHVWNFRDAARRLVEGGAALQVADAAALETAMGELLASAARREALGTAGRRLVAEQQGATERTIDLLQPLLERNGKLATPLSGWLAQNAFQNARKGCP